MKKTQLSKLLSLILCIVLIAAVALCTCGCGDNKNGADESAQNNVPKEEQNLDVTVLGNGSVKFDFSVVDADGVEKKYEIHTDKGIVGDALSELGLISGEQGDFGLYVKTVTDITLDYSTDGRYWAFYVDGQYGMSGVDTTEITDGHAFAF